MARIATVLLLAASLILAAAPAAAAKPSFTFVGDAASRQLESDARHLAFERPGGVIAVYDSVTGAFSDHAPPEPGCPFRDVGGGKLMWSCGAYRLHIVIEKLRTGQVRSLDVEGGEIGGSVDEVGTYWASGGATDHRGGHHDAWWSLVDGSLRVSGGGARTVEDLDRQGLERRLCSPLRRRANPDADYDFDYSPFLRYHYDGHYGLTFHDTAWELDECGRRGTRLFPDYAVDANLVAGRVSYMADGKVVVYDAGRRRFVRWKLRTIDPLAENAGVRLTTARVFVMTVRPGETEGGHVYSAPMPEALR